VTYYIIPRDIFGGCVCVCFFLLLDVAAAGAEDVAGGVAYEEGAAAKV